MLRFGPEGGPTVIVALPLFEEANRTRAALIDVLHRVAERGIGGCLPDLPGTGESLVDTADATLIDWRAAFADAARALPGPVHVVACRAGALINHEADVASRWHLAAMSGAAQVRELERVRQAAGSDDFAGNLLSEDLIAELEAAEPATLVPLREVRLESDPRAADRKIAGAPLWRTSEPTTDAALQQLLADDIAEWIASCDG